MADLFLQRLQALAHPSRLDIIDLLCQADDGLTVTEITGLLGTISQPTVSHHMKILLAVGLVDWKPRGRPGGGWFSVYRLRGDTLDAVAAAIRELR